MTSTTAISEFLNWLNKTEREYFIPWGYENLPQQVSGGDLDICVHPMDYYNVSSWLRQHGCSSAECPCHNKETHQHEYFVCNEYTVDMFTSFCFSYEGRTTVLNIDPNFFFVDVRTAETLIRKASPVVEALFTSLKILGGRKDCEKRLWKYLSH